MCYVRELKDIKKATFIIPVLKNQRIEFDTTTKTEKEGIEIIESTGTKRNDQNYLCNP